MRILSFIITLCFSFNVLAQSGSIQALERSLDEYQYAMSVEWDQKDVAFQEKQTELFFKNVEKLVKEEGLQKEDIRSLIQSKVKDEKTFKALELKMALLSGASSSQELIQLLQTNSKEFYSSGASWNGEEFLNVAALVGVFALFAYAIYFHATHNCVQYEYLGYDECSPAVVGHDRYGNAIYDGLVCSEATRCTEWVKK